ncbi:hypothetical protein LOD99_8493 [Oopsacas minuta]|uniref:Uncharacterized protein n=1 Tax=Oopsacas minuta TaxID=111878 RepID=A0AAV7JG43_9METZ|nr:hypothetical protein LOD99_8493 [Oopsacas minuta]
MGRKAKRKIHSHYSRIYQFRPRNGLGLYYPRTNSIPPSSIFHYNQRDNSPDCSVENDQDLVEGILFTSYTDLRKLESHSPLSMYFNSSSDDCLGRNSINIFEDIDANHLRSNASLNPKNSISAGYFNEPCFHNSNCNIKSCIPSLSERHQIFQSSFDDLSSPEKSTSKKCTSNDSKSPTIPLADVGNIYTKQTTESLPKKNNFINKSHPFLIENILSQNTFETDISSLNHACQSNVPYGVSYHERIRNDFEYNSLLPSQSEIHLDDRSITSLNTTKNSTFPQFIPVIPESKNASSSSLIGPASNIKYNCSNILTYEANLLSNYISTSETSPYPRIESLSTHKDENSPNSFAQHSTVNILPYFTNVPHKYMSTFGKIGSFDATTKLKNISSSLMNPHKSRICMNHANIAWSIYARETHLREEESREKGLYPLSLHNKNCFNRSILHPKAFRDIDCSFTRSRETGLHCTRALSTFPQPYTIFRRNFPNISGIDSNLSQNDSYPTCYNLNPLHLRLSSINQSSDQSANSLKVSCTENVHNLNFIPQYHSPFNLISNIEKYNEQFPIKRTPISNFYSNPLGNPDMGISDCKPIHCTNFSKILNPLLSPNILISSSEASHCQVTNVPIFPLHTFQPSNPNFL